MAESNQTLYERIGGDSVIAEMVDDFYVRVLADHHLRPYFENSSVDRLTAMQKRFFAVALDGPSSGKGFTLAAIHQGMGITREQLTRFVNHLIDVLDERAAISSRDAMDIIYRIATYSDQILGEPGGADG